mgnify:CR=1 FL=1|tara:strand:+ start:507 stop:725 length:219 start_codon:yes stop_codon:yes gene_type:complete
MYYGRIPPHLALGERVTISKEAQRKYEESLEKTEEVQITDSEKIEYPFILFLLISGSFVFGTVLGTLWSWYG